jgi:hypothetical protein
MLKLTYTEAGLYLEQVAIPLEILIAQRVVLAIRAGQTLHVEPGQASFLLPADTIALAQLELTLQLDPNPSINIVPVDADCVELSVCGSWIATNADAEEGTFVTVLSDRAEFFIHKLWQIAQAQLSYLT